MEATDDTLPGEGEGGETRAHRLAAAILVPGDRLGRYSILQRLGAGGMGVVYAAYDPELDRKVAVKLLHADHYGSRTADDPAQLRLVREARALARLSHPNVVAVHDVGTDGPVAFVAMEFVDGETLTRWLAKTHPRAEVIDVFVRAGRGLAAAHDAGLVHRDFKPDNVMIDKEGRVRVMDFGIVRADVHEQDIPKPAGAEPTTLDDVSLTHTGAIMGTPRYMAPEQLAGAEVDTRADQFSYCVALHEALYGVRPFAGNTLTDLVAAVTKGELAPVPAGANVPSWLRAVVLRGLEIDPQKRHPNMDALLERLLDDPARRRRRVLSRVAGVAALCGTAAVAYAAAGTGSSCEDLGDEVKALASDERRDGLARGFAASGHGHASEAWARIDGELRTFVDALAGQRVDACSARQSGAQSDALFDRRMACLDRRTDVLESRLEILEDPDRALVQTAWLVGAGLPDLERCSDVEALQAAVAPPEDPKVAAAVDELGRDLARAGSLEYAARYPEAIELARTVATRADELGYAPARSEALYRIGALEDRTGEYGQSERDLETAYFLALASGHDEAAIEAAIKLVHVSADELGHDPVGLAWARHAEALLTRTPGFARLSGSLFNNVGNVWLRSDPRAALDAYQRAHDAYASVLPEGHADMAIVIDNLGRARFALGDGKAALADHERALAIREAELGPEHPHVAGTLVNIATALGPGDTATATKHLERALAIRRAALGPTHKQTREVEDALAARGAASEAHDHDHAPASDTGPGTRLD